MREGHELKDKAMWHQFSVWFGQLQTGFQVALITIVLNIGITIVATPLRYAIDKRALRHKLSTEYEYEQRKKLRDLIGRYQGRVLEAATDLNYRIWNLYKNESAGWLQEGGYYLTSTVCRFLAFFAVVRQFEREAVFVDSRIAEKQDLDFVKYLKALVWAVTDVDLFNGLNYDTSCATDHFFRDDLRVACDLCCADGNQLIRLDELASRVEQGDHHEFDWVARFFEDLNSAEDRFRWDRLVALDLVLMAFINAFGYKMQRSDLAKFVEAARHVRHRKVLSNIVEWLPKLGLDTNREVWNVKRAIQAVRHEARD